MGSQSLRPVIDQQTQQGVLSGVRLSATTPVDWSRPSPAELGLRVPAVRMLPL